jgi:hypothetical protein
MFGVLAQLAVGFGLPEALVRGFLVGLLLTGLTFYLGRCTRWWHYPALLYCSVWTFQSVRDTSFALLTPLVQAVGFGIVAIMLLAPLVPGRPREPIAPATN